MTQKMRVMIATPEASPFAKADELADFCAALPRYLSALGIEVTLIMPRYRTPAIDGLNPTTVLPELLVPLGGEKVKAGVSKSAGNGTDIYFVDSAKYFLREKVYGTSSGEYLDNDERFIFFSRAVLEFLNNTHLPVDIIHCHNWPTALIPVFLQTHYREQINLRNVATVLTLHNAAYQGEFPPESLALAELDWDFFSAQRPALNGRFNFLKAGVVFADLVNTVSTAYKRELLTKRSGLGLSGILKERREMFSSVDNGIDYGVWNPKKDPYIPAQFSVLDMEGKKTCKSALLTDLGLSLEPGAPIIVFISPLVRAKGADILAEALDGIIAQGAGMVICGEGEDRLQKEFSLAAKRHPGKLALRLETNPVLIHKIMAGADILLLPSLSEPSGLSHFYAFRYGTVPVVRATGGLKETVKPYAAGTGEGNGFVFIDYSSAALIQAVKEAVECYTNSPDEWRTLAEEGMRQVFSWEATAKGYARLYQKALESKRGG